jgi:hypothetical protein
VTAPEVAAITLADPPERWEALGFTVVGSAIPLGGIDLVLGAAGHGIVGWGLRNIAGPDAIDGLRTEAARPRAAAIEHPNGAIGVDHVVVTTPDFDRTAAALADAGMPLRRVHEAPGGFRQGFRRLGPAILELVEAREAAAGPARFWGLVVIVADLDVLATRLGDHLGRIKDAVQPGRRIATLRASAGLGEAVAFMSPEP